MKPTDRPSASREPYEQLARHPLLDALIEGRSRRLAAGMTMNGAPLAYESVRSAQPLSLQEEAALAFAECGVTGPVLAELPYESGDVPEAGGGNIMTRFVGRTVPSGDAMRDVTLFVTNDEGAWILKRPQDYPRSEIAGLSQAARKTNWWSFTKGPESASPAKGWTYRASCLSYRPSQQVVGQPARNDLFPAGRRMLRPLHQRPALGLRRGVRLLRGGRAQPLQTAGHRPFRKI